MKGLCRKKGKEKGSRSGCYEMKGKEQWGNSRERIKDLVVESAR